MTPEQLTALRCAYADLLGALEAYQAGDLNLHDWKAHQITIVDLEYHFPELIS